MKSYINHSGGCEGADMTWEITGEAYKVHTIAYSFEGHTQYGQHPYIMNASELNEGWYSVLKADESLRRHVNGARSNHYVRKLLCRNWFQVKHSDAIFAVGKFQTNSHNVAGGTGWAVQMAIDNNKPVFFYDQLSKQWYSYTYDIVPDQFLPCSAPILTENFAGIGTRDISDDGIKAILDCYEKTFNV